MQSLVEDIKVVRENNINIKYIYEKKQFRFSNLVPACSKSEDTASVLQQQEQSILHGGAIRVFLMGWLLKWVLRFFKVMVCQTTKHPYWGVGNAFIRRFPNGLPCQCKHEYDCAYLCNNRCKACRFSIA
jgi:hypothetical protein